MKQIFIAFLCAFVALSVYSQTGTSTNSRSKIKQITYKRNVNTNVVRILPDLQIINHEFKDENNNNIINADENATIRFTLQNKGEGEAQQVNIKITLLNGPIQGLNYPQTQSIGVVYPTQTKEITIPLTGKLDLVKSTAKFKIEAIEKNGLDAFPLEMEIQTKEFNKPEVVVADAVFSTEGGGKIKLNSPINLKVLVQNIGKGEAKNVNAEFFLENANCIMLDANKYNIGTLKIGESKELNFIFTATRNYAFNSIPVLVALSENYGKYAEKKSVSVGLEENLVGNNAVVINAIESEKTIFSRASLTSDVDKDIPINPFKNPNRIALIIGNEDYSENLNAEINVAYAVNDATIFKQYVINTLGVQEDNVYYITNATAGKMRTEIERVSTLLEEMGPQSELIFYYAGHGLPDESTKVPYLIPVDVNAGNLSSAIKLSDVYAKFGKSGASRISVFLDACFSGGGRNQGLLTARGVKIVPRAESIVGNMVVFAATSGEQSALPLNKEKHGLFTYYLLKKFQETAGNISYDELATYINRNVSIESLKVNGKGQDPAINISPVVENTWKKWKIN